jgi:putative ABC transport system permease protein
MNSTATIIGLAQKSLRNRASTALLTILSIAISLALLVGVERIRSEARGSFANTISGTDLIVGARGGDINLLLYSVFRIGNATNNISWESYQDIASKSVVEWSIPISLGDSHRGFRVMGTNTDYFKYYRFGNKRNLELAQGQPFAGVFDTVLGADVASELGYAPGDSIVIAHGAGSTSFLNHDDKPFQVTGVLKKTGTPVDRTVHISLEGIEAIHIDWQSGVRVPGQRISAERAMQMDLQPEAITALLLGLKSRIATFTLLREINEYPQEPLLAIIPGVTLQQLWELVGVVEVALLAVSVCVVIAGLIGMLTSILTSLNERRREMAILRAVGARPWHLLLLLISESALLASLGVLLGMAMVVSATALSADALEQRFGIFVAVRWPSAFEWLIADVVVLAAVVVSLWPAWRAYRNALADGLTIRT